MRPLPAIAIRISDLLQDAPDVVLESPLRIMRLEAAVVADPPDVVADPVRVLVRPVELLADDLLGQLDRLEHRGVAEATPADVVDLADPGLAEELVEGRDQVEAVDRVADLLALVAEDRVGVRSSRSASRRRGSRAAPPPSGGDR